MKNKTFGNIVKEPIFNNDNNLNEYRFRNNGIEFFAPDDKISARDFNRPIRQLYEDIENNYDAFQTISKIVLGDKKAGIVPDVLEEFNIDNLIVSNFYNRTNEKYLRIPTGALVVNNLFTRNEGKQPSFEDLEPKYLPSEGKDFETINFIQRDHNSAFVFNRPKVELFERELADHYNIDLSEQDNDISIDYTVKEQKLYYRCFVTRTIYSDGELITKKIETTEPTKNIKSYNTVFDITASMYRTVSNYVNKDGNYSLEEMIPLKNVANGNYVLFFRAGDFDVKKSIYSISGDYGICLTNNKLKDTDIPLFSFKLENGTISEKKYLLKKINRAALDIKNLTVSNNYITVDEAMWHLCDDDDIANMI